ncbi:MAG: fumarylacetoacetate hydrolase family protein [Verrucomicrobiia bacterium]|jgi:2-keto-4-pentenoate hydratase/2-oxohepta-3-ene-1,7-dioic acid hydratase in catechol pathway
MKLCTFETRRNLRVGVVAGDYVVDLAAAAAALPKLKVHPDLFHCIECLFHMPKVLAIARKVEKAALAAAAGAKRKPKFLLPISEVKYGPPVPSPSKILCIGQNYADHCREQNVPLPEIPELFCKFPTSIIGCGDAIILHKATTKVDYEVELAIVIGKRSKNIPKARAFEHVFGYTIFHDVSARDLQFKSKQWTRGKSPDTFAPTGPWLVTRDEVPDPHNLTIRTWLNDQLMQDSNTANLVFGVPALVEFLSQTITLEPGDIIATGTPPGVGCFRKPPVFLKPGDVVKMEIAGLGTLENPVMAEK